MIAVADGFIVMLQWRPNPQGGQARFDPTVFDRTIDLKVFVEHSATVWSYVDHLVEVDESVMKQVPGGIGRSPSTRPNICRIGYPQRRSVYYMASVRIHV